MRVIDGDTETSTNARCTLRGKISATGGPVGGGRTADAMVAKRESIRLWTYVKTKGGWAEVRIDGTTSVERMSENERFYGVDEIRSKQIRAGEVHSLQLDETLMAVEGQSRFQSELPPFGKNPGEYKLRPRQEASQQ